MMDISNQSAQWYVAYVSPGSEKSVVKEINDVIQKHNLSDLIQEVFLPSETASIQRRGKKLK